MHVRIFLLAAVACSTRVEQVETLPIESDAESETGTINEIVNPREERILRIPFSYFNETAREREIQSNQKTRFFITAAILLTIVFVVGAYSQHSQS